LVERQKVEVEKEGILKLESLDSPDFPQTPRSGEWATQNTPLFYPVSYKLSFEQEVKPFPWYFLKGEDEAPLPSISSM
jgi:hypothetical protein